jgi:ClpP class serine protease
MHAAYPRIAERLFGRAHAIEPSALRTIIEGPIARRILSGERVATKKGKSRGERVSALVDAEPVGVANGAGEYALTSDGIAIVPICGVLSRRFDWLTALCGWTTYEGLAATFDAMLADQRVRAILMDVESPGGEASGMLDVADMIIAARDKKPVWAVANSFAASAAYAIAGSAARLLVPRLGAVGSIGAVIVHVDQSKADEAYGLKYTAIYSGERKVDGWGHAPIAPDARDVMQRDVDHCRDQFAQLVGRQGRLSAAAALKTEAAMFADRAAVDAGLADDVGTFAEALAALSEKVAGSTGSRAASTKLHGEPSMTTEAPKTVAEQPAVTEQPKPAEATPAIEQPAAIEDTKAPAPAEGGESASDAKKSEPKSDKDEDEDDKEDGEEKGDVYAKAYVDEVGDLCALAGVPAGEAFAFVKANTPVAQVRAALLNKRAAASQATVINHRRAETPSPAKAAGWDKAVEAQNSKFEPSK